MASKDAILKHMESTSSCGSITVKNTNGWYSAKLTVSYTFEGQGFSKEVKDITIGVNKSIDIPCGATDISAKCEEWWGFGWSTIFNLHYAQPVTKCYEIWGTTLKPEYKEVPC